MSKLIDFKIPLPTNLPIPSLNPLADSSIITMGDSFFNVATGFPSFPTKLKNDLNVKVHNYNIQGSGEPWRKTNPLEYLAENNFTKGKPKILILESVDRGLVLRYLNITKSTSDSPVITIANNRAINNDKTPPQGSIEIVNYKNNILYVSGWAGDNESGSPLPKIDILVDGKVIGQAITNLPRSDVASFFRNNSWLNSGWSFFLSTKLSTGKHKISANFYDLNHNLSNPSQPSYVTINLFDGLIDNLISWNNYTNSLIASRLKTYDFFLQENSLTEPLNELISTINFHFFHKISPLTPKYSLNPKMLFYENDVNFYQNPPSPDETQKIADNLKYISETLMSKYNVTLIFIPMPTKYTIYHRFSGDNSETPFFDQLFSDLSKNKVNFIDLYHPFKSSSEILYLPSDTHWNGHGITQAVDIVTSYIKKSKLLYQ